MYSIWTESYVVYDGKKVYLETPYSTLKKNCLDFLRIASVIDKQPTAYNPDKVVEQLEKLKEECEDPLQDYDTNYFIDKAIEIVKGGGVNELLD